MTTIGWMWAVGSELFEGRGPLLILVTHALFLVTWDCCLFGAGQSACEWHCPWTQTCGMHWERGETSGCHGNWARLVREKRRYGKGDMEERGLCLCIQRRTDRSVRERESESRKLKRYKSKKQRLREKERANRYIEARLSRKQFQ